MAESRKTLLDPLIMAKLMLLEYFKPASFRRLAEMQAADDGKPARLIEAELQLKKSTDRARPSSTIQSIVDRKTKRKSAGDDESDDAPETPVGDEDSSNETSEWFEDAWLREWLGMEPPLKEIDLRPYFYFSRDSLSAVTAEAQRLTPRAQEILDQVPPTERRDSQKRP